MTKSFTNSGQFKKGHVSWSTLNKGKYHFPKKEWNLVKGNCKICNKEFSAFLSKKKVFCSTICQYKARIGVSCNKGKIAWNKGLKGVYGTSRKGIGGASCLDCKNKIEKVKYV